MLHPSKRRFRNQFKPTTERLEERLLLSASSLDNRPYVDLGPSANVAWDQPRVTVQFLTQDYPDGTEPPSHIVVGPGIFNTWLLDTGANTTLVFKGAVDDMNMTEPRFETDGIYREVGVGGYSEFEVSIPYRFDFAGTTTYERHTMLDARVIANPDSDVSFLGPFGIVGMPAMTERVTTLDFTPWTDVGESNFYMLTDFGNEVPEAVGPRLTINVDNRVQFDVEDGAVDNGPLPMWADLPFLSADLVNNDSVAGGNFLFDTGAQVSIISSQLAFDLGLDTNLDGVLDSRDANFARQETIGGIGGTTEVPVFLIDEVHIPTEQGADIVLTDLQWLILDIVEGIDGVFGFDNMTSGWIEAFSIPGQSGNIMKSFLDFRNWEATGQGQIHFDLNPEIYTFVDPNGPGAIIEETAGTTIVSETGVTDSYTIRLNRAPTSNVTITMVGSGNQVYAYDAANPSNHFVTFTPANWNVPQTVQVAAVDDSSLESFHRSFLRNIATSSDTAFNNVGIPRVSVGIMDNDYPGVMLLPTDGETLVSESGNSDEYGIVLTTKPSSDVTVNFTHLAGQLTARSSVSGTSSVTFTPSNWNVPQYVTVMAIDDDLVEAEGLAFINHSISTADILYQEAFVLQERVLVQDNDIADTTPPIVQNVILANSNWGSNFIQAIDVGGKSGGLGYSLPGSTQLDPIVWNNVNTIYIQFSEDVSSKFNADYVTLSGTNKSNYLQGATFEFGRAGENIGTIRLNAFMAADSIVLGMSEQLTDAAGNLLNGEWTDGVSLISGNATVGGDFFLRWNILPGDINRSGTPDFADVLNVYRNNAKVLSSLEVARLDIDGNGGIAFNDLMSVYRLNGTGLPTAPSARSFTLPVKTTPIVKPQQMQVISSSHPLDILTTSNAISAANRLAANSAGLVPVQSWKQSSHFAAPMTTSSNPVSPTISLLNSTADEAINELSQEDLRACVAAELVEIVDKSNYAPSSSTSNPRVTESHSPTPVQAPIPLEVDEVDSKSRSRATVRFNSSIRGR